MDFNEYQRIATQTIEYPEADNNLVYPALGLAGEVGEVVEIIKKNYRLTGEISSSFLGDSSKLEKEMGDVLWYLAALCTELDIDLDYIARLNLEKLKDRKERGVIKGEGDNR